MYFVKEADPLLYCTLRVFTTIYNYFFDKKIWQSCKTCLSVDCQAIKRE